MIVLAETANMSRLDWLRLRQKGIGGSDAAAISGLNKYKSPIQVYYEKVEGVKESVPSEAAYWGTILEDIVAQEFSQRTGLKVRRRNAILCHPEYPFMIANVDRLVVGEDAGLECKTASEYLKDEWVEGEKIPDQYFIQCQHYMAVTGRSKWYIAVLIGGNKFRWDVIERDEEIINYLIEIEAEFWQRVIEKRPPEVDGSEASTNLLNLLYPVKSVVDDEAELPGEVDALIAELEAVNAEIKEKSEKKAEIENKIKALLGERERGRTSEYVVKWSVVNSNRFDSKRFAKEHPDLYRQYVQTATYRRFSISKNKKTRKVVS
ncbi:putative phage-type endonuclease domain protein [Anoxybacillus sp. B7M1]|uniref:YqaJ viral recombinase family nuclease n=1 Tax=unclassified Anoxybacillus TaxID=2639704 RepID=UPI0005CDAF6E|nr:MULTISPECIES: YqaJ viral recombinase family protein [unclassified Anoxybacillus]ANB59064.1 putative phage-type endonuclease domain protein [Anoxybacillus sp. B2M1]ANB64169.1 putative phage-type endonuclease domain protein [Anoxybacillus sp. B7M1]